MNTSVTSRILWPYGPARVLFSVVAVLSAVGLFLTVPAFAKSPLAFSLAVLILFALGVSVFEWGVRRYESSAKLKEHEKRHRHLRATQNEIRVRMARVHLYSKRIEQLVLRNEPAECQDLQLTANVDDILLQLLQEQGSDAKDFSQAVPIIPVWLFWSLTLLALAMGVFLAWLKH